MSSRKGSNISTSISFVDDTDNTKKFKFDVSNITTGTTKTLTIPDSDSAIILSGSAQTLTNKTIDSNNNTITNIVNADIKASAAIDATKIADGSVSNTNFQILNGETTIYGVDDSLTLSNKSLVDTNTYIVDNSDNTKKLQFELSNITTSTTRTITPLDSDITLVGTDTTQTLTNKTLTAPIISSISNSGTITVPTGTDTLVGKTTTDTLQNKTLIADNSTFADLSDNTKKVELALSGITTGNTRQITVPDSNLTIVGLTNTQTVSNKSFDASNTYFIDNADNTKKCRMAVNNITTGQTRVITAPNANTTLVGTTNSQTLTNKTISSSTNTVAVNEIRTTGASVNISSAVPPTTDHVLTATGSTTAIWKTLGSSVEYSVISATTTTSTTSTTYVQMNSMTTTPASGTYIVIFNASGASSQTSSTNNYAIYSGGTIISHSERIYGEGGGAHTNDYETIFNTQAITTVNGSQVIEVRFLAGGGTFTIHERNMVLIKVA